MPPPPSPLTPPTHTQTHTHTHTRHTHEHTHTHTHTHTCTHKRMHTLMHMRTCKHTHTHTHTHFTIPTISPALLPHLSPATEWDKVCRAGDHKAPGGCPCHSLHRSCTAGKWTPSRSTVHTVPALRGYDPPHCLPPGSSDQGSRCVHPGTGNCTHTVSNNESWVFLISIITNAVFIIIVN